VAIYKLVKGGNGLLRIIGEEQGCSPVETVNLKPNFKGEQVMSVLAPSSYVEGSGLIDDVDVTFAEVRVVSWDYNGKVAVPVPALKINMSMEDGTLHEQYYSLGKASDWQPSDDGKQIIAVGKATGLTSSSNAAQLIQSMVNCGFPEAKITEDVTCFEGLNAHMSRIPAPKRGGAPKPPREDGRVFEDTILVVGSIISFPWDKKAAKGKPATAGTAASAKPATAKAVPAAAAATTDDLDERCAEVLMEILAANPNGMKRAQIPGAAFKLVAKDPNKNKIVTRIFAEDFLSNGAWTYANGEVSMG
jgi:hypothetical protein